MPQAALRLEVGYRLREESVPSAVHAGPLPGSAAGGAECLEGWTCTLGPPLHRDRGQPGCVVSIFVFRVALREEVR